MLSRKKSSLCIIDIVIFVHCDNWHKIKATGDTGKKTGDTVTFDRIAASVSASPVQSVPQTSRFSLKKSPSRQS